MRSIILALGLLALPASAHAATYTFDTGFEGFAPGDVGGPFDGILTHESTGGNPGGFLRMQDGGSGGSLLPVLAPIAGDLTGFKSLSFDQRLDQSLARRGITVELTGTNGDIFTYIAERSPTRVWSSIVVSFKDDNFWTAAASNAGTFGQTLASVGTLQFLMDVGPTTTRLESDLDNVSLSAVPLPAGAWLMLSAFGMIGLLRRWRQA